jgi:hypothetical protein
MKKQVVITFVTEADSNVEAVFNLNKLLLKISETDLSQFQILDVLDVLE